MQIIYLIALVKYVLIEFMMIITGHGKIIRLRAADISVIGRNTQGVKLIDLGEGEKVVGVAKVMDE